MKRLLMVAVLIAACTPQTTTRSWSDDVQGRIDAAVAAADCVSLQAEFEQADDNGNARLMEYVDQAMQKAGCY